MKLLLVRHPEPEIAPGICYGRLDLGLSPEGRARIPALAAHLRATGIARIYTSPARRCRLLAEVVGDPVVDPRLQELDFGDWEGRSWDEIGRPALDAWAADTLHFTPPGGESVADLLRRLHAFVQDLKGDAIVVTPGDAKVIVTPGDAKVIVTPGDAVVIITHGGPLRLLPALLARRPLDLRAAAPPFGTVVALHLASADNAAHSLTTAHAPSTSPVKPPI